ncbi:uncharacterized protein LOC129596603 [Paramacrobiotus metropolitanus]|uniref:uncharacterized protein LOC129596603 n=1 Tax=Paramacrobiotus metropolitanus TaxID=2943436 RepID=UPI002445AE1B|nr:uncharacterized protein LOC129596603 [Paramacrobiotus metropolitanus]
MHIPVVVQDQRCRCDAAREITADRDSTEASNLQLSRFHATSGVLESLSLPNSLTTTRFMPSCTRLPTGEILRKARLNDAGVGWMSIALDVHRTTVTFRQVPVVNDLRFLRSHRPMCVGGAVYGFTRGNVADTRFVRVDWRSGETEDLSNPPTNGSDVRGDYASVCTSEGIFYCGGWHSSSTASRAAELFNLTTKHWTTLPEMLIARREHAATVVDEFIYVTGGWSDDCLSACERFNRQTHRWERTADVLQPRCCHAGFVVDGQLYVFGGQSDRTVTPVDTMEAYDARADKWREVPLRDERDKEWAGPSRRNQVTICC